MDPRDPETLYVAGMEGTFLQSKDGGRTWRRLGAIPGGMATWVSQSVAEPSVLYAAAGGGVSKSTDGGESWRSVGGGLPNGVSTVVVSPDNPQVVYAGVLRGEEALVYRSDDGGETWETRNG